MSDNKEDESTSPVKTNKPKGVSLEKWQRFQALKNKRQKLCTHSLAQHDGAGGPDEDLVGDSGKTEETPDPGHKDETSSTDKSTGAPEEWSSIQEYMGQFDHLQGLDRGNYAPKTRLEVEVDEAIAKGDFETAERLSDHLADRQLGKRITDAVDAKNFAEKRKKEEELVKSRKKKKLKWGFEHKEKWEMKGNM